jgi:hypothetical protein
MPFWNEEERARLDKMRSEFLSYKEEASKRMEEIRIKIESFSPPRTSPASQAQPIQLIPSATRRDRMMSKPQVVLETRTRNKKAEGSTKPPVAAKRFFGAKDAALLGRTSERQQVPIEEYKQDVSILVPIDIISVKLGDILPADAHFLDGESLKLPNPTYRGVPSSDKRPW